jgi:hypothetical protein
LPPDFHHSNQTKRVYPYEKMKSICVAVVWFVLAAVCALAQTAAPGMDLRIDDVRLENGALTIVDHSGKSVTLPASKEF